MGVGGWRFRVGDFGIVMGYLIGVLKTRESSYLGRGYFRVPHFRKRPLGSLGYI